MTTVVDDLYETRDDGSIVLFVHAQPGAGRTAVVGRHGQALKVKVAAPPEGGRANDAVVKLLAESFGVAASNVELVAGESSRSKRFRISEVDPDDVHKVVERLAGGRDVADRRSWRDVR